MLGNLVVASQGDKEVIFQFVQFQMFIVVMGTTMYMSCSLSCCFKTKMWLTKSELSIIADGRCEEFESRIVLGAFECISVSDHD